jgi:prevent-host-death family protein
MNAPIIFNVHETKTQLSKLLERAHAGEELIVAKAGVPYARLMPLARPAGKRTPGALAGLISIGPEFFEPLPASELAYWNGEA